VRAGGTRAGDPRLPPPSMKRPRNVHGRPLTLHTSQALLPIAQGIFHGAYRYTELVGEVCCAPVEPVWIFAAGAEEHPGAM